jgi:hypothetical protein
MQETLKLFGKSQDTPKKIKSDIRTLLTKKGFTVDNSFHVIYSASEVCDVLFVIPPPVGVDLWRDHTFVGLKQTLESVGPTNHSICYAYPTTVDTPIVSLSDLEEYHEIFKSIIRFLKPKVIVVYGRLPAVLTLKKSADITDKSGKEIGRLLSIPVIASRNPFSINAKTEQDYTTKVIKLEIDKMKEAIAKLEYKIAMNGDKNANI